MALTRKEFDVLSTLATSPDDARAQAASPELDELRSMGLVSGTAITELGRKALEPYRVENAVIMAAGLLVSLCARLVLATQGAHERTRRGPH